MTATETLEPRQFDASVLHRVSGIVSSELCLDEMLGEIVGLTSRVSGCDACLVYLVEAGTNEFVLRASLVPHVRDLGNLRMKMGEGVTGWVAEHQSPVALSSNATADSRFKLFPALIEDTYEAFLSVPLVNKGKAIGVINVHHRAKHEHTPEEIATISFIGEQMGSAIAKSLLEEENARLTEETAEMKRQLETRKAVERAKGILQKRNGLSEEEAYLRMRNESRRLRRPMKDLADAIILSEELARKESVAQAS
ncbi:MAG TPA: ANTAR domain-containing protein [Bryobacteraceae bacterium]|nr:ANTAR domain-containing protein [Bryobacteraceae bacterium]